MNPNEEFRRSKDPAAGIYMKYVCANPACGETLDLHVNKALHGNVCTSCESHDWIFVRYDVRHKEV